MRVLILFVLLYSLCVSCFADTTYYSDHARGWHWYEKHQSNETESANDPTVQMSTIKAKINHALDKAIINPTEENVANYIELQHKLSSRSAKFANQWQYVLLKHPEWDASLVHPSNSIGRQVEIDEKRKAEDQLIKSWFASSGLFFFYHSTCPYCQRFAPILKHFSESYGIEIVAITTDGISLPEFPDSKINQGQAEALHVTVEPALFAVNPKTKKITPIGYGLMSEDELRERILLITAQTEEGAY